MRNPPSASLVTVAVTGMRADRGLSGQGVPARMTGQPPSIVVRPCTPEASTAVGLAVGSVVVGAVVVGAVVVGAVVGVVFGLVSTQPVNASSMASATTRARGCLHMLDWTWKAR